MQICIHHSSIAHAARKIREDDWEKLRLPLPPERHMNEGSTTMHATAFCSFGSLIVQLKRQSTPIYCGPVTQTTTAVRYVELRVAAITAESLQLPLRCESLAWCLTFIRSIALPNSRLPVLASAVFAGAHGSRYIWKGYISRLTCIKYALYHDTPPGYLLLFPFLVYLLAGDLLLRTAFVPSCCSIRSGLKN